MNKHVLRDLNVKPSKSRGQNFLESPAGLEKILDFAAIRAGSKIIEIGPGLGVMTEELSRVGSVIAIEVQPEFCERLRHRLPSVQLIENSVLSVDFNELPDRYVLVGNLPYSLSSSIVFHILNYTKKFERAIFLLQKEFVQRMAAEVDTKNYGVLSIMVQTRADLITGPIIKGDCFFPKAKVDSQVVELRFFENQEGSAEDYDWLHTVVHAAFHQRRKKIYNAMLATQSFLPDRLMAALKEAGIDPEARPETIEIPAYRKLASLLA